MKLKRYYNLLIFFIFLFLYRPVYSSTYSSYNLDTQPDIITSILKKEKNIKNLKFIIDILNQIDKCYGNLYNNIQQGQKITIFIDPAHGKLSDGRWEGELSGRVSCANIPEEQYSLSLIMQLPPFSLGQRRCVFVKNCDLQ